MVGAVSYRRRLNAESNSQRIRLDINELREKRISRARLSETDNGPSARN